MSMIMNIKRGVVDETPIEKFLNAFKMRQYLMINEMVQSKVISTVLMQLLLIIEFIHMLYYSINTRLNFLFTSKVYEYFQTFVKYFQVSPLLQMGISTVTRTIIFIVVIILILSFIIYVITCFRVEKNIMKSSNSTAAYGVRLLSLFASFQITIFTIPFCDALYTGLICLNSNQRSAEIECYGGFFWVTFVFSIIGILLHFGSIIYFTLLFTDLNPFSTNPLATPYEKSRLFKTIIKVLLPIYLNIDSSGQSSKVFIFILFFAYLILISLRVRKRQYYDDRLEKIINFSQSSLLWVTLVGAVHAAIDTGSVDEMGVLYLFLCWPIAVISFNLVVHNKKSASYSEISTEIQRIIDMEIYIFNDRHNQDSQLILTGILHNHIIACKRKQGLVVCRCTQIDLYPPPETSQVDTELQWFQFLQSILVQFIEREPRCSRLHLLNAYLLNQRIDNQNQSLYELIETEVCHPTIQEELSIYSYKTIIQDLIIENDIQKIENVAVNVNLIVDFQNKYENFKESSLQAVELHNTFWSELIEPSPDIQKLQLVGSQITSSVEKAKRDFEILFEINQNNIKTLQMYGEFLSEIVNDEIEGNRMREKAETVKKSTKVNKQFVNSVKSRYNQNSTVCVMSVSGNPETIGIVNNVNNQIMRLLNYTKEEIVDQNVNRLMPKLISDIHEELMMGFLATSKEKVVGKERYVIPLNKAGYIVPSILLIQVLPTLDEGLTLIGFLNQRDGINYGTNETFFENENHFQTHYLCYKIDKKQICGITNTCFTQFGIPSSLVNGTAPNSSEFTIDLICPQILLPENQDALRENKDILVTFDTSTLPQRFLLENNLDEAEQEGPNAENENHDLINNQKIQIQVSDSPMRDENNEFNDTQDQLIGKVDARFRKTLVRIWLDEDLVTDSIALRIIRFVQVIPEMEKSKQEYSGEDKSKDKSPDEVGDPQVAGFDDQSKINQDQKRLGGGNNALGEDEEFNQNHSANQSNQDYDQQNDKLRTIKDIQLLITEKTVPKSIRQLKVTVCFLFLVFIVITSIEMSLKNNGQSAILEQVDLTAALYRRRMLIAKSNLNARKIQLLANGQLDYSKQNIDSVQDQDSYVAYLYDKVNYKHIQTHSKFFIKSIKFKTTINQFQDWYYRAIKALVKMEDRFQIKIPENNVALNYLMQNGDIKSFTYTLNDGMLQYISSGSSLVNSELDTYLRISKENPTIKNTNINFYFITENGIRGLRDKSGLQLDQVNQTYSQIYDDAETLFFAIFLVGIIILCLSQFFLMYVVSNVHKSNNRVLSIFGIIPESDIQQRVAKCIEFNCSYQEGSQKKKYQEQLQQLQRIDQENLKQQNDKSSEDANKANLLVGGDQVHDQSHNLSAVQFDNSNAALNQNAKQEYFEIDNQHDQQDGGQFESSQKGKSQGQYLTPNSQPLSLAASAQNTNRKLIDSKSAKNNKDSKIEDISQSKKMADALVGPQNGHQKDPTQSSVAVPIDKANQKAKDKDNEDNNDADGNDSIRTQQLMNSQDSNSKVIICQFSFWGLIYLLYFIINYYLQISMYLNNVQNLEKHFLLAYRRPSYLNYLSLGTIEELSTLEQVMYNGSDLFFQFVDSVYSDEDQFFNTAKYSFPSLFDSYVDSFNQANFHSSCSPLILKNHPSLSTSCPLLGEGILTKGLQTSIISMTESARGIINGLRKLSDGEQSVLDQYSFDILNGQQFRNLEGITDFITTVTNDLNDKLNLNIRDYLNSQKQIETIKFSLFIIILFLLFVLIWNPFLEGLNEKIWRAKGMLNMIPMSVISNNPKLLVAFTKGDVLKAVR